MLLKKFYEVLHFPKCLIEKCVLHIAMSFLQGVLIWMLLPIFHALLRLEPDFYEATPWLIGGAIVLILHIVLVILATPTAFAASAEVSSQTRQKVMEYASRLPLGWFTADHKARLARAVTADSARIGTLSVTIGAQAINAVFGPSALCVVAFLIDWRTAVPLAAGIPVLVLCLCIMSSRLRYIEEDLETAASAIAGRAVEFGHAQPVLRAAGKGNRADIRMREAINEHQRAYQHGLNISIAPYLGCMAIPICAFIVTLIIGINLLLTGILSIADAIVLFILTVRYVQPLGSVVDMTATLGAISNSLSRVQDILRVSILPSCRDPVTVMKDSEIEFYDVTFAYNDDDKPVLRNVSFLCPAGSATALVGASGAGKTTVTKLIARFFDVNTGSVRIGGIDVREYDHASLLKNIAIVFQDVYLFDGTIEENLRLARPDATKEQIETAARSARLDEVIGRLPGGWQTRVGEAGAVLSGGERQRVSIARAFLKEAPIMLIDEAVSAIDPQNERVICDAIADLASSSRRTVIIIAHHPAILAACDHVLALKEGQIAETGSPEKLRHTEGVFAHLYDQYERIRSWRIRTQT